MGIEKTYNIVSLGSYSPASGEGYSEVALLSITTEPSAPFSKGSKYFNNTDNKIHTAVADNTWQNNIITDPLFNTYYQYGGQVYVWDGNSLELFELEKYQKIPTIVEDLTSTSITLAEAKANTIYKYGTLSNLTIIANENSDLETVFYFTSDATITTSFPNTLKWVNDNAFSADPNTNYVISVVNNIAAWASFN